MLVSTINLTASTYTRQILQQTTMGVASKEARQFSRSQPESSRPMGGICPLKHSKTGLSMAFPVPGS